jgi:hypothetical protein
MVPKNNTDIKKMKLSFAAFYAASVLLLLLMAFAFTGVRSKTAVADIENPFLPATSLQEHELLQYDAVLHTRLSQLQQLDEQYAMLLTDALPGSIMDNTIKQIVEAESALSKTLDSVETKRDVFTGDNTKRFDSLSTAFRAVLQNRRAISGIRTALLNGSGHLTADEKSLLKMDTDLKKKDDRIAELEKLLKNLPVDYTAHNKFEREIPKEATTSSSKETEELKNTISQQEKRVNNLASYNSTLRQDNEQLKIQLEESRRAAADESSRNRTAALQRKVDDLDAELLLAQVDCNLNRADAKQIIYSARQRKDLLTEALKSLTNLSGTANTVLQQKVKEKTERLNRIASTVRD